ncbi:MAG: type III ribulose-bisphosphate carboxylase [Patescibacteria group bacterium]|jgi:ribulose-bisphosphate carboxylase large chain
MYQTSYKGYANLNYKPNYDKDVVVTYYLEPAKGPTSTKASAGGEKFEVVAEAVAGESSIGTWTHLDTLSDKVKKQLSPKIFVIDKKRGFIKIAYPLDLFELGSIPQILSSIGGNVFSMKMVERLRLEDIEFPKVLIDSFSGPQLGIAGIRKLIGIKNRPLVGSIMKPKVGMNAKEYGKLAYQTWKGGVDVIKDDENLTSLSFNKFEDRVNEVLAAKKKVEKETGEKKVYVFNVTAPADIALKRAKYVKAKGGNCIMVDIVTMGWSAIQYLRAQKLGLIIHGHRAGHSTFTKDVRHGISMLVVAKLSRLAGIDQLHTGTVVGKMEGTPEEVSVIDHFLHEDDGVVDLLREDWSGIKSTMPIASGGLHPALAFPLVEMLGNDLIINFGGGIHGHPNGSLAGAKAARAAVEAASKGISIKEAVKISPELKVAVEYWAKK